MSDCFILWILKNLKETRLPKFIKYQIFALINPEKVFKKYINNQILCELVKDYINFDLNYLELTLYKQSVAGFKVVWESLEKHLLPNDFHIICENFEILSIILKRFPTKLALYDINKHGSKNFEFFVEILYKNLERKGDYLLDTYGKENAKAILSLGRTKEQVSYIIEKLQKNISIGFACQMKLYQYVPYLIKSQDVFSNDDVFWLTVRNCVYLYRIQTNQFYFEFTCLRTAIRFSSPLCFKILLDKIKDIENLDETDEIIITNAVKENPEFAEKMLYVLKRKNLPKLLTLFLYALNN